MRMKMMCIQCDLHACYTPRGLVGAYFVASFLPFTDAREQFSETSVYEGPVSFQSQSRTFFHDQFGACALGYIFAGTMQIRMRMCGFIRVCMHACMYTSETGRWL